MVERKITSTRYEALVAKLLKGDTPELELDAAARDATERQQEDHQSGEIGKLPVNEQVLARVTPQRERAVLLSSCVVRKGCREER